MSIRLPLGQLKKKMFEGKRTSFELNISISLEDNVAKTKTCLYIAGVPGKTFSFVIILFTVVSFHIVLF